MAEATNPITTASNPRVGEDVGRALAAFVAAEAERVRTIEVYNAELKHQRERGIFPPKVQTEYEAMERARRTFWTAQHDLLSVASAPSPEAGAGGDLGTWIEDRLSCAQGYIDLCADNGTDNPYQKGRVSLLRELQVLLASTGSGKEETKGGWQPLKTAPQDGEVFLVASVAGIGPTLCSFADGYFRLASNREKLGGYGIWFWHRLPVPPDEAALRTLQAAGEVLAPSDAPSTTEADR